jgi:uncharacterized protein YecE (DUF72 family)
MFVGTSGWQYQDWRGPFYPRGLPARLWLEHFADQFATVEINNAFYRLPERDTFAQWRERTGPDFVFSVKMSRYLTHIKRLRDPAEPVARFMDRADVLGDRLGPVLMQLPPNLHADADLLGAALAQFPRSVRVAVEPRHESWWSPPIRRLLEHHDAALVWADRLSRPITPLWRTADWGYVRFHEGRARPSPRYGSTSLRSWLDRIVDGFAPLDRHDMYVYFNNDHGAAAIHDASAFGRQASRRSLPVTRFP